MKNSIENELKYALSLAEYLQLKLFLKRSVQFDLKSQRNFYFDTESLELRKQKIGLRIRYEDKALSPLLTLKFPTKGKNSPLRAFRRRNEFETKLSAKLAQKLLKLKTPFSKLTNKPALVLKAMVSPEIIQSLTVLGCMVNSRYKFEWTDGLILELDRFKIFKHTFYELEVETEEPRKADALIRQLFKDLNIRYRPSEKSKLGRFMELRKKTLNKI